MRHGSGAPSDVLGGDGRVQEHNNDVVIARLFPLPKEQVNFEDIRNIWRTSCLCNLVYQPSLSNFALMAKLMFGFHICFIEIS